MQELLRCVTRESKEYGSIRTLAEQRMQDLGDKSLEFAVASFEADALLLLANVHENNDQIDDLVIDADNNDKFFLPFK